MTHYLIKEHQAGNVKLYADDFRDYETYKKYRDMFNAQTKMNGPNEEYVYFNTFDVDYASKVDIDVSNGNKTCPKNIKDLIEKFVPEFDYNQDNNIYGKDAHVNTRADLEKFANELQQLMGIKSIQINATEVSNDVYTKLKSETNAIIHRKDNSGEFIIFHTFKNGVLL
jgi:hypothetical protein